MAGNPVGVEAGWLPTQASSTYTGSNCNYYVFECRGHVCLKTNNPYLGPIVTCSTHLVNQNTSVAQEQAREHAYIAGLFAGSAGKWLAGDFNLTPGNIPSNYGDGFVKSPNNFTHEINDGDGTERQLDYVWHDKAHTLFNINQAPDCFSGYSDHCYVFSRFG